MKQIRHPAIRRCVAFAMTAVLAVAPLGASDSAPTIVRFVPLGFEEGGPTSRGTEPSEQYVLRRICGTTIVTADGFSILTADQELVTYAFLGVAPTRRMDADTPQPGVLHSFTGNDPGSWTRDRHHFGRVRVRDLYPGIDLELQATHSGFEYDLVAQPGADLGVVRIRIVGAREVEVDDAGSLLVRMANGAFTPQQPIGSSIDAASRQSSVPMRARFIGRADGEIGIECSEGRLSTRRVVDPVVEYVSYLGGTAGYLGAPMGGEEVFHTLPAADGTWIVVGVSSSTDFPVTPGSYFIPPTGFSYDIFVRHYSSDGSSLIFSTLFGGALENEIPYGATLTLDGEIVIAGQTSSPDLPITPGAVDPSFNFVNDGFVLRLSFDGSMLVSSTYVGGSGSLDIAHGVVLDAAGNSVLAGQTNSPDFPTTVDGYQRQYAGFGDAFVTVVNRAATQWVYSTYFGGALGSERGYAVGIDENGSIHFGGDTNSIDFPVTAGAVQTQFHGQEDAFVAKLQPGGGNLRYCSYFGGGGVEFVTDMKVNSKGQLCFVGEAQSGGLPTTPNSFDPSFNGFIDCFVATINTTGTALIYSAFFGGLEADRNPSLALDSRDRVYLVGSAKSSNLPLSPDAFQLLNQGGPSDAFLARISSDGAKLEYASLIGGSPIGQQQGQAQLGIDFARAVGVSKDLHVWIGGLTSSMDFPVTSNAEDFTLGWYDGFLARFNFCEGSFATIGPGCVSPFVSPAPSLEGAGCPQPGYEVSLRADGMVPNSPILVLLGLGTSNLSLKPGCLLSIAPLAVTVPSFSSAFGTWEVPFEIPSTVTSGSISIQLLVADPIVTSAVAATNSIRMTIVDG